MTLQHLIYYRVGLNALTTLDILQSGLDPATLRVISELQSGLDPATLDILQSGLDPATLDILQSGFDPATREMLQSGLYPATLDILHLLQLAVIFWNRMVHNKKVNT